MSSRNLAQRLRRLEDGLTPVNQEVLRIVATAWNGEIVAEYELRLPVQNRRGWQREPWGHQAAPIEGEPADRR
jgi:hypothetical protein